MGMYETGWVCRVCVFIGELICEQNCTSLCVRACARACVRACVRAWVLFLICRDTHMEIYHVIIVSIANYSNHT